MGNRSVILFFIKETRISIRKKIRPSYRHEIGDLYMVIKKPMPKSKTAKRRLVIDRNWVNKMISKFSDILDKKN